MTEPNAPDWRSNKTGLLGAGLLGLLIGGGALLMAGRGQTGVGGLGEKARIEAVVRDYLLANPEIIPEAMQRLQGREAAKAVALNRAAIETPYAGAWSGAADADVTLVEFYDYACGYCRQSLADVDRLLAEDRRLKVVYRELPVLGPNSEAAALASLAAARAGKFKAFHNALYGAGRPEPAKVAATSGRFAIPAPAPGEGKDELRRNLELASALGISGTPAWVVGDQLLSGAVGYEALKKAIAEERAKRG